MKEWDYAQLAKTASEHGGPQKYIDEVADTNFSLGFNHGHDSGVKDGSIGTALIFGGAPLLYEGGKWVIAKIKGKRTHDRENDELRNRSDEAKTEFVATMKSNEEDSE